MWRNIVSNFLTILIVGLVMIAGLVAWAQREYAQPGPLANAACYRVERGATIGRVSRDLADMGAISSAYIFRAGADYAKKADQLKFGSYLLEPSASMEGIVEQITRGGPSTCGSELNMRIGVRANDAVLRELDPATGSFVEVAKWRPAEEETPAAVTKAREKGDLRLRVTIAEGVTSWQVVQGLNGIEALTGEVSSVPAEGTLAPDSYQISKGDDRNALIAEMVGRQAKLLADAWAGRDADLPYQTPEEALVMASIIEKETGVPTERKQVASVFVNRLRQGMKLQTDPTVIYGVTKGEGVLDRGLRQSELKRETPYNTYVIEGLPPTPIANPGAASIEAAMHPDATQYLFFVADGSGGHAFATTLDEHNRNVAAWRKIEKESAAQ
ncbi:endolytic transglycosylase MltG [Thioclava sp. A2]|uniref:endolytic transglycosylase MltG n=1 Tax=Thioclava sp. FCG-A2 TaxID=3080562 RepID=UPI00295422C2|nr:endolytic transglycosylase MltG [Thioclava sp. A2]MDV7269995.1 endolytic transglycosylase MltG [Thioclava sp. A2]